MKPTDMPGVEHFMELPCGSRAKYIGARCRCLPCRAANSRYETGRAAARKAGEANGLVSAAEARAHLIALSRRGVGRRAVADACDVSCSTLAAIRTGRKTQIRVQTARRILAVTPDARAAKAFVPAGPTRRLIAALLAEGFSRAELARRLGYRSPALQLKAPRITAENAMRVERFYRRLMLAEHEQVAPKRAERRQEKVA